jgi:hypothetical protein
MTMQPASGGSPVGTDGSSLVDVIDTILDKGLVIDAHVGVSVVGIQLLSIDARVVIASVDTYLRFAEAVNRLDLSESEGEGLPEVVSGVAKDAGKKKMIDKAGEILGEIVEGTNRHERQRVERRER